VLRTLEARLTEGLGSMGLPNTACVRNRAKTAESVVGQPAVRKQQVGPCLHYMMTPWRRSRETERALFVRNNLRRGALVKLRLQRVQIDGLSPERALDAIRQVSES
jgi:hypothetical protein